MSELRRGTSRETKRSRRGWSRRAITRVVVPGAVALCACTDTPLPSAPPDRARITPTSGRSAAVIERPISAESLNVILAARMAAKQASHEDGRAYWGRQTDAALWSRVVASDSIVIVGLKAPSARRGVERGRVLVGAEDLTAARSAMTSLTGVRVVASDTLLPIVTATLASEADLARLRQLPFIDYVEPAYSGIPIGSLFHSSGCGAGQWDGATPSTTVPGDFVPQNYEEHQIPDAWYKSTGSGITIGLVDTGIDAQQPQLNSQFGDGWSYGRSLTIEAIGSGTQDPCGHGTHMASAIAAPRDGSNIVGVAWGANLLAVRAHENVVIGLNDIENIRLGIRRASQSSHIIAMAFGSLHPYSSISDEIDFWYYYYDRLFIGAAGTGVAWAEVVFPAQKAEVLAVSGVSCPECSYGVQVDLLGHEEQPVSPNISIGEWGLAKSSGSSNATAVVAGIAALVWGVDPARSRSSVMSSLIHSASPTGFKHTSRGWGPPNAWCAVGGFCHLYIDAERNLIEESGHYTFTAYHSGGVGPFSYQWATGETTKSKETYILVSYGTQDYQYEESVTVTDHGTGQSYLSSVWVTVRQPTGCPTCP